jgi:hypothetical protein
VGGETDEHRWVAVPELDAAIRRLGKLDSTRSEASIQSERMAASFRVKPEPQGSFDPPSTLEEMIDLAARVRAEQDALPVAERVFVGGELVVTALFDHVTSVKKIHQFEDFSSQWLSMEAALRSDPATD